MALPVIPPVFLPVFLLIGMVAFFILLKAIEKLIFLILMVTVEIGMAFLLYAYYLPDIMDVTGLSMYRLYPPIFWDKVLGALVLANADISLIATALICLGLLYVYLVKLLKRQGLLAPIFAGIILIAMGLSLPGFRAFLNAYKISWLFYGTTILVTIGIIGYKYLGSKKSNAPYSTKR